MLCSATLCMNRAASEGKHKPQPTDSYHTRPDHPLSIMECTHTHTPQTYISIENRLIHSQTAAVVVPVLACVSQDWSSVAAWADLVLLTVNWRWQVLAGAQRQSRDRRRLGPSTNTGKFINYSLGNRLLHFHRPPSHLSCGQPVVNELYESHLMNTFKMRAVDW
jgi:hypothetical protein